MIDIAQLGIEVRSDGVIVATNRLDGMAKASGRAEAASDRLAKRAEAMGRILGRAAVIAGAGLSAMAVNSIRLAVAAEETAAKFQTVFRGSVDSVNKSLVEMTKTIPLTVSEMRGLASGMQDMLVPMGLAREEAAQFSVQAVQLAADIGSFNSVDPSIVLQNIQSALAGSSEPMRKYGVDVRKTRLETIAYEHGLARMGEELNQAAIAQATFIAITQDSSDAMGNAARTAGSNANQMRFLSRDIRQAQEDLGAALIPAFAQLLNALNQANDDGITPLQEGMRALSTIILNLSQVVLMSVAGWKILSNAAANAMEEVRIAVIEGLQSIAGDPAIVQAVLTVAKTMGGPAAAAAVAVQNALASSQAELAASAAEARARIVKNNKEMEKSTEKLFAAVSAARAAIDQMGTGIDRTLEDTQAGIEDIIPAVELLIPALREMNSVIADELRENFEFLADLEFKGFADELRKETEALKGGAEAWEAYQREMFQAQAVAELGADATDAQRDAIAQLAGDLFDARAGFDSMTEGAITFGDALSAYGSAFESMFRSLQDGTERGSDAYKVLELAVIATNMVQAIGAILNQAQGDPYSAPARMAAMAAIVSGLIGTAITLGSGGGGNADLSAERQARLGTGGVLGDSDAQSESILNATEATADATSKLVNLSTGMLRALLTLNELIANSAMAVNRTLASFDFGPVPSARSLLGGSVNIADIGIEIDPVRLSELMDTDDFANLFRDIGESRHFFDGVDFSRERFDIPEGFVDSFRDVIFSMVDVVSAAAKVLGFSQEEIDQALADFVIWEEDISFKDMNLEEQQEALEVYFSSLFDSISHTVVGFLPSMQKAGEGLGETLIRVATSIELFRLAADQLGFSFSERNRKQFANMAADLVELVGGIEAFIDAFSNFIQKFASEEQQFEMLTEGLVDRLAEVGLELPDTRQGFFDLIGTLDATTEAGRDQIATLLGLVDSADAYYTFLEEAAADAERAAERLAGLWADFFSLFASQGFQDDMVIKEFTDAMAELGLSLPDTRDGFFDLVTSLDDSTEEGRALIARLLELAGVADAYYAIMERGMDGLVLSAEDLLALAQQNMEIVRGFLDTGPPAELMQLRTAFVEAMKAAESLGASSKEYALIMRSFDRQLQRMAAELTIRIIQISQGLFGSAADEVADGFEDGFDRIRTVANSLFSEWQRALTNIKGFADNLLLNEELTTLSPREQLRESRSQFESILARARAGDVDAANELPGAAQAFLEEARFMFASGPAYDQIFREVQDALRGIQMPKGIEEFTRETAENTFDTRVAVEDLQNETVVRLDRLIQAMDLSNALRDLGYTLDQNPIALAEELGVPLDQLAEALGIDITDLSLDTLMGIVNMAELLGADLHDLGVALGVDIDALAAQFGVILSAIDFDSQFMTQNDWNSAIYETLEQMESWLAIIAGAGSIDPLAKDPRFKGGELEGISKIPKPIIGDPSPQSTTTDSAMAQELSEVKAILADMRDDSQSYYKTSETQTREVVNATVETADVLRRKAA